MDILTQPIFVFLLFALLSRYLTARASKMLDQEKKAELMDLLSKDNLFTLGIFLLIFAAYYFLVNYNIVNPTIGLIGYFTVVLSYIIYNAIRIKRILTEYSFLPSFITAYTISISVRFLGLVIFFILMLYY